jgi:hypothetical protein
MQNLLNFSFLQFVLNVTGNQENLAQVKKKRKLSLHFKNTLSKRRPVGNILLRSAVTYIAHERKEESWIWLV